MEKCYLCKSKEQDEIRYGEFMTRNDLSVHYFCLLLTSNLLQRGRDCDGFLGFLEADIKDEAARVKFEICCYCKKKGANIACCAKKCRKSFHLICGIKNDCENQFVDTFKSFCDRHVPKKKTRGTPAIDENCCICYDSLRDENGKYNSVTMLQAPCCKNGWFHKWCLASFAKSAGYFFKCPLCNDSKTFRERLVYRGIFIPDRDASWELEPNAYSELLERPAICSADDCNARGGRTSNSGRNKLILCLGCGSVAMHRCCIEKKTDNFYCNDCQETFTEVNDETVVNVSRHSESDEEADVDICGEVDDEPALDESRSSDEILRPIRRRNARLQISEDESSFDVNITDTEETEEERQTSFVYNNNTEETEEDSQTSFVHNISQSSDEFENDRIQGCRRNRRIESSDSGNSMETVVCEAKLRTSNNSESFFDSGAGSDPSDCSADKSHSMDCFESKINDPAHSRPEKSRGTRRYTSLNDEPKVSCIAKRTRRQSMYSEMSKYSEESDIKKESATSLPGSSSSADVSQTPTPLPNNAASTKIRTEKQPIFAETTETPPMQYVTQRRRRIVRSKSQCVESSKLPSQRRSSLHTTMNVNQEPGGSRLRLQKLLQTESLSNKRCRSESQSSTDASLNKRQKGDDENENDGIIRVFRPRRRSSRSRSPLGTNCTGSINAFITPLYVKEKHSQPDGLDVVENYLTEDTLKPRIEKMYIQNQTNISNHKTAKEKPPADINNVSHTSSERSTHETFRETFSNSYKILLSATKRRRTRKNAFQRFTDNNLPSNQTRIETFFKRI